MRSAAARHLDRQHAVNDQRAFAEIPRVDRIAFDDEGWGSSSGHILRYLVSCQQTLCNLSVRYDSDACRVPQEIP
jgi:hypothetical protein